MKRIYIIAIVASVIAGVSLYNFLITLKQESKINYVDIIVTAVDIQEHTVLTADMLSTKQIPIEGIHPLALKNKKDIIGLVTSEKIYKGEQLISSKLEKIGKSESGLSYSIPDNMRAITVAVDEVSGVSGFINPGDRVDILGVMTLDEGEKSTQTSSMFLQNIKVLAVGKTLVSYGTTPPKEGEASKPKYASVTLLTSPEDAVRLNLITSTGSMRIILRGPTDKKYLYINPRNKDNISS